MNGRPAPELSEVACYLATAHRFGDLEVIQLFGGTLYRACTPEEAEVTFPRRGGVPARPLRRVQLVDVPRQQCVYCLELFPTPIEQFHDSEACASKPR